MATGLPLGSVPRTPLLVPVSTHRDVTRVPSSVWKVSTVSTCRSLTRSRNCFTQFLMLSLPEISWPPASMTTSSDTNRSTASGSCAFQTSSQKALTISVDRIFARSHSQAPPAGLSTRTQVRECNWTQRGLTGRRRARRVWNLGREYSLWRGAELRDGQPLKPGNCVTADNKISMCSEPVRTRRRGCELVHCATIGWQQRATRSGHGGR